MSVFCGNAISIYSFIHPFTHSFVFLSWDLTTAQTCLSLQHSGVIGIHPHGWGHWYTSYGWLRCSLVSPYPWLVESVNTEVEYICKQCDSWHSIMSLPSSFQQFFPLLQMSGLLGEVCSSWTREKTEPLCLQCQSSLQSLCLSLFAASPSFFLSSTFFLTHCPISFS